MASTRYVICYFDITDLCVAYKAVGSHIVFRKDKETSDVVDTGEYILPENLNPINRTAEQLIKFGMQRKTTIL